MTIYSSIAWTVFWCRCEWKITAISSVEVATTRNARTCFADMFLWLWRTCSMWDAARKTNFKICTEKILISLVNIFDQCASCTCIIHCFPSSCGCSFSGVLICHVGTISHLLSQLVEQVVISAAVHIFGIHFQWFFLLQLCLKVAGTVLLFEKLHVNAETENARTLSVCCL